MASRETIMNALLGLLATTGDYKVVSRRNRAPETVTPALSPALFLVEDREDYRRPSASMPAIRTLTAKALIYNNVSTAPNAVPSAIVNAALDALDGALKPDNVAANLCTLGGLAYSVAIDGEIIKAPGDVSGFALAIVPIKITLP